MRFLVILPRVAAPSQHYLLPAVVCASACGQRAVLDRVASLGREGIPFFDDALLPSLAPVLSGARG